MSNIKPLVAGNWKMNGIEATLSEVRSLADGISRRAPNAEVMLCPPATLISATVEAGGGHLTVGGQDCHIQENGAHTGDISAEMLADAGAAGVILGHSERRADHGERSEDVASKASAAYQAGLTAIICVGETAGERAVGLTLKVIERQLMGSVPKDATAKNTVVAYEPVWAIGTGLTPTATDVAKIHAFMRTYMSEHVQDGERMRLLYGGSVKAANAAELMGVANVNGALVGGASLKAVDFLGIIDVYV